MNHPQIFLRRTGQAYAATWLIDAPWAHPLWSQYVVHLYDVTTPMPVAPEIRLHMADATHEVDLYAVSPKTRLDPALRVADQTYTVLEPPNLAVQFRAASDHAATDRVQRMVEAIEARALSPDSDFTRHWETRFFEDGVTLRKRAAA